MQFDLTRAFLVRFADEAIVEHAHLARFTEFKVNGAEFSRSPMNLYPVVQPRFLCAPTEMKGVLVFVDQRVAMQVDVLRCRPAVRHIASSLPRVQKYFLGPTI